MQPQETGFDWWHALSGMVGAAVGAASTLLTWIIRAARMEPTIRGEIIAAEQRVEKKIDEKIESEMANVRETLSGIRQKINDVELDAERRFLPKDEFNDFRAEYREDIRDIKAMIAGRAGHAKS